MRSRGASRLYRFLAFLMLLFAATRTMAQHADLDAALLRAAEMGSSPETLALLKRGANVNARDRYGRTPLIRTVSWTQYDLFLLGREEACADLAEKLIAHGADIDAKDKTGRTALMWAAGWEHLPTLKVLLRHNADLRLRDHKGRTAMTWAAGHGADNAEVKALRQQGAPIGILEALLLEDRGAIQAALAGKMDLTTRGPYGETALMDAAEKGDPDVTHALLAHGASPDLRDESGLTALMLALSGREHLLFQIGERKMSGKATDPGRREIVQALLAAGASVNAQDRQGQTPLHWALRVGTPEMIRLLLDTHPNVNLADFKGRTLLMEAIEYRLALIPELLQHGADIDAGDQQGNTVFLQAAEWKDLSLLMLLREKGADIRKRNRYGQTALMLATRDDVETAAWLMQQGLDPAECDQFGWSALTYAALRKNRPLVRLMQEKGVKLSLWDAVLLQDTALAKSLIARGAPLNRRAWYGDTVLTTAIEQGDAEIVRALMAKGADPNIKNRYRTPPLLMAIDGSPMLSLDSLRIESGPLDSTHLEMIHALVEGGADVDAASWPDEVTPLILASASGRTDLVRYLLEHGADPSRKENGGLTALTLAVKNRHSEVAALLRQAGAKEQRKSDPESMRRK